jgi:formylglycine-generating enzyme required for sulfatase activity
MEIPYPLSALDLCPLPVETVGRAEVGEFLGKVKELTGEPVRWPAEAEWEYACRAGTTTRFHNGDTDADLARAGWFSGNGENKTHEVGQKEANAWGLYDMHGNVWEWCQDGYGTYDSDVARDPTGPSSGSRRVLRGGSWNYNSSYCRSASRFRCVPFDRYDFFGLRVVLLPR